MPSQPKAGKNNFRDGKPPIKEGPYNIPADQNWFDENAERLTPVTEDDDLIPANVRWIFDGDKSCIEFGSYWNIPSEGNRCHGISYIRGPGGAHIIDENGERLTRPCLMNPILGADVCVSHGGGAEKVKQAAKLRLLAASDYMIGMLIQIALDPGVDARSRVQAINSILDRADIKSGANIELSVPGWQKILQAVIDEPIAGTD